MSIARAFTTRRVKQSLQTSDLDRTPQRSSSTKGPVGSIRHKISSPIELVHTTNMLSYNAPDIQPLTASSTGSSHRSDDDMSDGAFTNGSTPPTSPDIESSPKRTMSPSPAPNHLSSFFTVPSQTPPSVTQFDAPVAPQRAPSHTKKQYNTLKRQQSSSAMSERSQRTVSTKASFTFSRSSSTSTSTSVASGATAPHHRSKLSGAASPPSISAPIPKAVPPPRPQRKDLGEQSQHPFGPELAQVSELAEEYGVKEQVVSVPVVDEEEEVMLAKGLLKFSADEYLSEVRGLFGTFFSPPRPVVQAAAATTWI